MMRQIFFYLIALVLLFSPVYAKKKSDEVDYTALAALLISDGHYDRAEHALNSVNIEDKSVDLVRFYKLKGLIFLKKELYVQSIELFQKTLKERELIIAQKEKGHLPDEHEAKLIHLYLAQAYYKINRFEEAIESLDNAKELALEKPNLYSIKAQCYWKLKEHDNAWSVLDEAQKKFPEYLPVLRQKFFYLLELGLFQRALEYGQKYLKSADATYEDYLAIGSALRKSSQHEKALHFLESAKLLFPYEPKIIIELAHVYLEQDKIATAAGLFEEASRHENRFSQEASELFRRAGKLYHALYLNSKITDAKEKYKQRMALFLEFNDMEMAAAMGPALSRVGLLENEDMRYALAYSQYMIGHFDAAEENLQELSRPDLFKKAAELRKSMQECTEDSWKCR